MQHQLFSDEGEPPGPAGEEIHTDRHGRIKVQFHWDRLGKRDDKSSRWVRVAQMNWSGGTWGGMAIPRIGMEVVVEFIEGDPDRPLVTGSVYNGENKVPYALPENKTRMTLKSKTYKGTGFNEIMFEDMTNKEEFYAHAQKDMDVKVENNKTTRINASHVRSVGRTELIEIEKNKVQSVYGSYHLNVGTGVSQIDAAGDKIRARDLLSSAQRLTDASEMNDFGRQSYSIDVRQSMVMRIGKNSTEAVAVAKKIDAGESWSITAGKYGHFASGEKLNVSTAVATFNFSESFAIRCGAITISGTKDGALKISAKTIEIDAPALFAVKSAKITSN